MTPDEFTRLETLIRSQVGGLRTVMDRRFDAVDTRFEQVDARFDAMDTRFEQVDARFDAMDTRFDAMRADFDSHERVASDHFARLHARTGRIEIVLESVQDQIATVAEGVTSNGERLDRMNGRIDGVESLVKELAGVKSSSD